MLEKNSLNLLEKDLGTTPLISTSSPFQRIDHYLIASFYPDKNPFEKLFYQSKLFLTYDIDSNQSFSWGSYPEEYGEKYRCLETSFFYHTKIDSSIAVSFMLSDSVYLYDLKGELKTSFFAGSSLYQQSIAPYAGGVDQDSRDKFIFRNRIYTSLIHDKYRNKIYRIVLHPIDTNVDLSQTDWPQRDVSIIVFSALDYSMLYEVKLPENKYEYYSWFLHESGFYMSAMNDYNNEVDEEYFTFQRLDL